MTLQDALIIKEIIENCGGDIVLKVLKDDALQALLDEDEEENYFDEEFDEEEENYFKAIEWSLLKDGEHVYSKER